MTQSGHCSWGSKETEETERVMESLRMGRGLGRMEGGREGGRWREMEALIGMERAGGGDRNGRSLSEKLR